VFGGTLNLALFYYYLGQMPTVGRRFEDTCLCFSEEVLIWGG